MKTVAQFQAKIAEEQGRVRSFQARLFELDQRQNTLNEERQVTERQLSGALGRMNAWTEARQIAAVAAQEAAKAQGGPAALPESKPEPVPASGPDGKNE